MREEMMKKLVAMAIASVLVIGMAFFTACIPGKKLKVTLYLNGTLGDKSFYDSAGRGLEKAIDELGIEGETIEGGYDQTRWEPDLEQVSRGDADIIIVGTWQMKEILEKIAPRHPLKKYFIFDTAVDYTKPGLHNVYSILYKQNEGSFLAGALAALVTASDMARVNKDKTVGFLGGIDESTINDFKAGYIQGVHHIDPEIQVLV